MQLELAKLKPAKNKMFFYPSSVLAINAHTINASNQTLGVSAITTESITGVIQNAAEIGVT